jgi:PAS domain-containing protein
MNESVSSQADLSMIEAINKLPTVSVTFRAVSDGTLKVINYSDGFCRMMHCTPQEAWDFYSGSPAFRSSFMKDNRELIAYYQTHCNDASPASFSYRIPLVHGGMMWVSVTFYSFDADGERYVYVVFSDIDELKRHDLQMEEQYQSAQTFMDSVAETYMAVRRSNLTQNRVETAAGTELLDRVGQETDYDRSISRLLEYIPEESERAGCAAFYARDTLRAAFAAGRTTVTRDYPLCSEDGASKWVRSVVYLARRPGSGDLISFSTVRDVSSETLNEKLASRIIGMNYNTVSYCDLGVKRLYVRAAKDPVSAALTGMPYQDAVDRAAEQVDPAQQEVFRSKIALDAILAALEKEPVYTFYYARRAVREDLPGCPRQQMKNDIFYLDEHRGMLVFLLSDVTEITEQDRESPRADGRCAGGGAAGQRGQDQFPFPHEPRDPHAAQRDHRDGHDRRTVGGKQ